MSLPSFNESAHISICQICHIAKLHRLSFPPSHSRASNLFELLHVDIWDPHLHSTHNGCKYFATIVADFLRATWVHLLAQENSATPLLNTFIIFVIKKN